MTVTDDERSTGPAISPGKVARWGWPALSLLLGLVAYRLLLDFRPFQQLPVAVESFFFVPSIRMPPIVILVLTAWLAYRPGGTFRRGAPVGNGAWLGTPLLLAGAAIFFWASYAWASDLLLLSLACLVAAAATLQSGREGLAGALLPALMLVLAVPIPAPLLNQLVFSLQLATAHVVAGWLDVLGIPALVAGEQILLAGDCFAVVEGCSGLRSMQVMALLGVLWLGSVRRTRLQAAILLATTPAIGFLLNALRVFAIVLYPTSEAAAAHQLQGIAALLLGVCLLVLVDDLLERLLPEARPRGRPPVLSPSGERHRFPWAPTAAVLAVCCGWSFLGPRWSPLASRPAPLEGLVGARIGEWNASQELDIDRSFLGWTSLQKAIHRRYERDGRPVDLYVGWGDPADRGRTPLSPKAELPGSGWIVESKTFEEVEPGGLRVTARLVRSGAERLLVYHWTRGSQGLAAETLRTLVAWDRSPWRRSVSPTTIRISTPVESAPTGLADARSRLEDFSASLQDAFDEPLLDPDGSRRDP